MESITGRKAETELFSEILNGNRSEFAAVYGRRRVGKTFLIREIFSTHFTFQLTGIAKATTEEQLANFDKVLKKTAQKKAPKSLSWFDAFDELIEFLSTSKAKRKVVFIDELPWLDTPNSRFIHALEHFWNSWASARKDIVLITCGSAASWMISKLINNKGGLHNRVTRRIKISPFTLNECETFIKSKNAVLDRYQIIQLYMVLGGIPFYWNEVSKKLSATQNIQEICFNENGLLRTEFQNLFSSIFTNFEKHTLIATALAKKAKGLTRNEILKNTKLTDGGSITKILLELEESGFIRKYKPFNKKTRESLFQLVDFYTLFYFRYLADDILYPKNKWINSLGMPTYNAWSGYAFEQVCLYHVSQIKNALQIGAVDASVSSWKSSTINNGAQIDLVIDRRDQVINLCEMKFSINKFSIDKKYDTVLRNKIAAFRQETKTKKALFLTMITTLGISDNAYAAAIVQNSLTMDALFTEA